MTAGAYYNEKDKFCAQWLRNLIAAKHIAAGDVDERDIRDVPASDVAGYTQVHLFAGIGLWSHTLRLAGWSDDRPVWTCSCPCQPFSAAGRGAGIFDDRHLWPAAHWLIAQLSPVAVVGEQVAGPDGQAWLDIVSDDLEALRYTVGAVAFCSAGVGAPNIRQRLYWVARRLAHADSESTGRNGGAIPGAEASSDSRGQAARRVGDGPGNGRADGRMGDAGGPRLSDAESSDVCGTRRRSEGRAIAEPSRPPDPWRELEWIACADGKLRPTQPGLFPLAARHPGDVAKLRAYGNAINPIAAAQFLKAIEE